MPFKDPRPHWSVHDDIPPVPYTPSRSSTFASAPSSVASLPLPTTSRLTRAPSANGSSTRSPFSNTGTYLPPTCLMDSNQLEVQQHQYRTMAKSPEVPLWHSVHKAGGPTQTAFDINDRGNRVYFKFEPSAPTYFPVQETRFYKPNLHKTDFLGTGMQRSL